MAILVLDFITTFLGLLLAHRALVSTYFVVAREERTPSLVFHSSLRSLRLALLHQPGSARRARFPTLAASRSTRTGRSGDRLGLTQP
jgi:hypothetical protein